MANQEREGNEANNLIATAPISLGVHELTTTGMPASGVLTSADRADYYAVYVEGGQNVGIVLDGHGEAGTNELYVAMSRSPAV